MTPLERAARALCQEMNNRDYDGASYIGKRMFQNYVRAVLQSIREPSEAMAGAGSDHVGCDMYTEIDTLNKLAADAFRAMIDAALEEG